MTEPVEVGMARMQENMKAVLNQLAEAKQSRKEQYAQLDAVGREVSTISNRLQTVETQLAAAAPTLAEFVVFKHKLQGAGTFGRWLWAIGGFLIGSIAYLSGLGKPIKQFFEGN